MKQKTIITEKVEMLLVELLTNAMTTIDEYLSEKGYRYDHPLDALKAAKKHLDKIGVPYEGNWQHLGKATELTEEDWKGIVDRSERHPDDELYIDYTSESTRYAYLLKTATESGLSLLKANGVLLENSILSTYPVTFDRVTKKEWQEAQSKVWDKERTYIFIKVE